MIQIDMTEEQAKWLQEHLVKEIENARWRDAKMRDRDAEEHAATIADKIQKARAAKAWEDR